MLKKLACYGLLATNSLAAFDFGSGEIHGFVSQGFLASTDNNFLNKSSEGDFSFNCVALNYMTPLGDRAHAGLQLMVNDVGGSNSDSVMLDWAFADYHPFSYLGFRVGKTKLPLALHNEARATETARTWVYLPVSVYNEQNKDFLTGIWGVQAYGDLDLHVAGIASYNAYIGRISLNENSQVFLDAQKLTAAGFTTGFGLPVPAANNRYARVRIMYGGSLQLDLPTEDCSYIDGLRLAGSIARIEAQDGFQFESLIDPTAGPNMAQRWARTLTYTASVEYSISSWIFTGEYNLRKLDSDTLLTAVVAPSTAINVNQGRSSERWGAYGSVEYLHDEMFTFGGYYGYQRSNRANLTAVQRFLEDVAATVRIDFLDHWTAKIEGHVLKGANDLSLLNNPAGFTKRWYLFATRVTASF